MVTFKANAFFLVGSHMRISVSLVLIFVGARVTFEPDVFMAVHVSIKVTFVLETATTPFVFTHEIMFCLMCSLMLLQSAFEWEALTTVFTDKAKLFVEIHMFVQC